MNDKQIVFNLTMKLTACLLFIIIFSQHSLIANVDACGTRPPSAGFQQATTQATSEVSDTFTIYSIYYILHYIKYASDVHHRFYIWWCW